MNVWNYCPETGKLVEVVKNNGLGQMPCLTIDKTGGTYCRTPECTAYHNMEAKKQEVGARSLAEMFGDLNIINNH